MAGLLSPDSKVRVGLRAWDGETFHWASRQVIALLELRSCSEAEQNSCKPLTTASSAFPKAALPSRILAAQGDARCSEAHAAPLPPPALFCGRCQLLARLLGSRALRGPEETFVTFPWMSASVIKGCLTLKCNRFCNEMWHRSEKRMSKKINYLWKTTRRF